MKKVIVPFFIAHQGCPYQCIFCDQKAITGSNGALPTADELVATVRDWRRSSGADSVEVAFYGGSFTLLPFEQQTLLLRPLAQLLQTGEISSIRLSTRPDALDAATAGFLREAGVSLVELGVQSMDDRVLAAAGRGHSARAVPAAFAVLRAAGLQVGAQLMPGLPGETAAGAVASFRKILALQPDCLRIYPAVVLQGTRLAEMYQAGRYQPLLLTGAVAICKILLHDADCAGIPVIRAGLQPTDDLSSGAEVVAGPYHPAFRQLAEGERWFDLLKILCGTFRAGAGLTVWTAPTDISTVIGQKRTNIRRLEEHFRLSVSGVRTDHSLGTGTIRITAAEQTVHGDIRRDLTYP